jgi:hypothetical protein
MRTFALAAGALATAATLSSTQGRAAADGDLPEYEFRRPLLNGMGVSSLAELQGKPVLVEFWGTR